MAHGELRGKYTAAEAKALSSAQRQALCLRTLDLTSVTVPEKEQPPKTTQTALCLSGIRYTYSKKAGETLTGASFSVWEHEIVGLVGATGCGKSTIARLIASLWDVQDGAILLGGVDIRTLPLAECTGRLSPFARLFCHPVYPPSEAQARAF